MHKAILNDVGRVQKALARRKEGEKLTDVVQQKWRNGGAVELYTRQRDGKRMVPSLLC
ncbi:hypothetical protein Syun_019273 [Stephania yunnanensis]|uniref:Uncharacterized protein n=1 Tax=Stephania yunnanensis TaxID=152371 RepID=A0AAP0ITU0_9MAGN